MLLRSKGTLYHQATETKTTKPNSNKETKQKQNNNNKKKKNKRNKNRGNITDNLVVVCYASYPTPVALNHSALWSVLH